MKLSPTIRAAITKLDAAHAAFFAALDREARRRPSLSDKQEEHVTCRLCGKPLRKGEARYREQASDAHAECREKKAPRPGVG